MKAILSSLLVHRCSQVASLLLESLCMNFRLLYFDLDHANSLTMYTFRLIRILAQLNADMFLHTCVAWMVRSGHVCQEASANGDMLSVSSDWGRR